MTETDLFAFYGSLRRGMENYNVYAEHLQYIRTAVVKGYALYSLIDYPYAVKTDNPNDLLVVELFAIADLQTKQIIHEMELDAGYIFSTLTLTEGKIGIYTFATAGEGDAHVPGGDWVVYHRTFGF
ncbi:gamma-glutamylcyclotransferase [Chryseolinea lacunae]|uniref:Gamma-glutamylcyclotransferase n=1 Tax=Chryseolinea lacunae TaxID=2801331 RepID=A0ABS1KJU4_9BACT|nr:gamma-glutamylcyclotransferase [Chryseolinea lacunae]MBL0739609.1 gamma-glutamylcyclotransferase [Chryseolinea lacunae]